MLKDLIYFIIVINAIIVIITIVFIQKKRPESVLLWMMAFLVLPLVFVLIFYLFLGRDYSHRKLFRGKAAVDTEVAIALEKLQGQHFISELDKIKNPGVRSMVRMLLVSQRSYLTWDNEVRYINDGDEFFKAMFEEIAKAKRFIHFEMYIVRKDEVGTRLAQELARKAKEGVEVKLLLDAVGSRKTNRKFFKDLIQAGGRVEYFFPSILGPLNTRMNNRDHRKIIVIDGDVSFVGGYNIGKEYAGRGPLGYWRDCMVRIQGSGSVTAEQRFILDWNFAAEDHLEVDKYAPTVPGTGKVGIQIVSCGPDTVDKPIEEQYVKMITSAKDYVYIQTPYLVPGEAITAALVAAAKSGVDVRVMIPSKPDHPFVYWASLENAGNLLSSGVRVHQFKKDGFIHAKVVIVDDIMASVGSANLDRRSFELNFET
ncbi:MAG: cardiolipin synthase, partial [Methanomassiliicoccales archaeon]|nr:cardiolipin synthase [Methanomassiliicoccales archaeon]